MKCGALVLSAQNADAGSGYAGTAKVHMYPVVHAAISRLGLEHGYPEYDCL